MPRGYFPRKPKQPCEVKGCDSLSRALGYCDKHYRRFAKYGNPLGGPGRGRGPRPNRKKDPCV